MFQSYPIDLYRREYAHSLAGPAVEGTNAYTRESNRPFHFSGPTFPPCPVFMATDLRNRCSRRRRTMRDGPNRQRPCSGSKVRQKCEVVWPFSGAGLTFFIAGSMPSTLCGLRRGEMMRRERRHISPSFKGKDGNIPTSFAAKSA